MTSWAQDAIWWHVYPLGFVGAEQELATLAGGSEPPVLARAIEGSVVRHRLEALFPWLDYLIELGCNGLALAPIFASASHGYDTLDFFTVDPRLGDETDLTRLIEACHGRGIRVLLDGVFNHVGWANPAFQRVLATGPSAPEAPLFRLRWPDGPWQPGVMPAYGTFEGHGGLIALDHDAPAVVELVARVMTHWLDLGVDGWRLDAAYAVDVDFWARVLPRVRARHPEAYIVGEVIHGDYAQIVASSGMDAVTQYELWKASWSSLNDANFWELDYALSRHNEFLDHFIPYTFVGNHDVTRIASKLTDPRHVAHAVAILATVGGTPAIYYGDEQGYHGVKEDRIGGDDQVRPRFPELPEHLSELGRDMWETHRALIGLRRRHRWLHTARTAPVHLTNTQYVYAVTPSADELLGGAEGRLLVALSIQDGECSLPAPGAQAVVAGLGRLVSSAGRGAGRSQPVDDRVILPAHGWAVLAGPHPAPSQGESRQDL